MSRTGRVPGVLAIIAALALLGGCSGNGGGFRGAATHGIEYGQYHGPAPWSSFRGDVAGGPLPEMGMPQGRGGDMGMGIDMGGLDF